MNKKDREYAKKGVIGSKIGKYDGGEVEPNHRAFPRHSTVEL